MPRKRESAKARQRPRGNAHGQPPARRSSTPWTWMAPATSRTGRRACRSAASRLSLSRARLVADRRSPEAGGAQKKSRKLAMGSSEQNLPESFIVLAAHGRFQETAAVTGSCRCTRMRPHLSGPMCELSGFIDSSKIHRRPSHPFALSCSVPIGCL